MSKNNQRKPSNSKLGFLFFMRNKKVFIPEDCQGAVLTALRIRIIYLQSYRLDCERHKEKQAAEAMMKDIANLTMIMDRISESPFVE